MTKDEYLAIRDNPEADVLPVMYFYYKLQGGTGIPSLEHMKEAFGLWLIRTGAMIRLGKIIYMVEVKLNKYFNV